ncbi:hypothetical protein [Calycomorphotria hydatis]|uniref:Uncharacterized protein n=1 Tax=Calycomorphotria hydatis TaxID=2528027 RepID=A0A517TFB5_9PLAN|nr:hypothetical protein [Calycomorphotria hydatis]QDT67071.1 hypothetical protein V22_43430 [Calycomorphotria hydatis]
MRRFLHYASDASTLRGEISARAVEGCWFELHRQGGCGAGELRLSDSFLNRTEIRIGEWIAFEWGDEERWYFGRIEEREADSPAGSRFTLEGMAVELNEIFPGGFNRSLDAPPHRFAATDLFSDDPDRPEETFDSVGNLVDLVERLFTRYISGNAHISWAPSLVETPLNSLADELSSVKLRGEESVRSLLNDLALRAEGASWGVNEHGQFYFLRKPISASHQYREGVNTIVLTESRDRDLLFNRVLLTGGYVYGAEAVTWFPRTSTYRWRGNYIEPNSRDEYGERRIRISVPWIRTATDSRAFVREFFKTYALPTSRYVIEVGNQATRFVPWLGQVELRDRNNQLLTRTIVDSVRVQFDHFPRFRMQLGPADPRTLWPEPDENERWEIPGVRLSDFPDEAPGGEISAVDPTSGESFHTSDTSEVSSSVNSSITSSAGSSDVGSSDLPSSDLNSSDQSSAASSTNSSAGGGGSGSGQSDSSEISSSLDSSHSSDASDSGDSGLSGSGGSDSSGGGGGSGSGEISDSSSTATSDAVSSLQQSSDAPHSN